MAEARASQRVSYSFLKILTGSDLSKRRLPIMKIKSPRSGPVVWLTACAHGDEVGGIAVIQDVFRRLRQRPLRRGAVHAFPLMNAIGFETASRHIPSSQEDLNRAFPGSASGTPAERLAHIIFTTIEKTKPSLVVDLHNDWIKSVPYTVLDPDPGAEHAELYGRVRAFAERTGFLMVGEQEGSEASRGWERTLSGSLLRARVPALTLELGEAHVVNAENVEYGVQSVWNVLAGLEMVEAPGAAFRYPTPAEYRGNVLRYTHEPVNSASGIVRFFVDPGELVKKGRTVARVYNAFGKLQETVRAKNDGIVLGHSDSAVAFPGLPLVAFGVI